MPRLADLPAGFNLVLAESFPIPTTEILHDSKIFDDPSSSGSVELIRRERISGYQIAFTNPRARQIQCSVAVYRSGAAARKVYRLRAKRVAAFVLEAGGRLMTTARIGEETDAHRFALGRVAYRGLTWRFRNVLSSCTTAGGEPSLAEILVVARAQQARIASALDEGRG